MSQRRYFVSNGGRRAQSADLMFVRVLCAVVTFVGFLGVAMSRSTELAVLISIVAVIFLTGAVFPRTVPPLLAKAIAVIAALILFWTPPSTVAFHAENLVLALPMWGLAVLLQFPSVWRTMIGFLSPRPGKVSGNSMRVVD